MNTKNIQHISLSTGTLLRAMILVGLVYVLSQLGALMVSILVAVVIASSVEPMAKFFKRYNLPRGFAVAIIYILFIAIIGSIIAFFVPKLADDVAAFIQKLPSMLESMQLAGRDLGFKDLSLYLSDISKDISKGEVLTVLKNFVVGTGSAIAATGAFVTTILNLVIIIVLSFYLASEEKGVENFLRLVAPKRYELYIIDLWSRSQAKISAWAQGQLLLGLIMSILMFIAMSALGVPYAALLALFTFMGELVPLIGLTLAGIPAILLAFSVGGYTLSAITLAVCFVLSQVESHIIYPKIMNKMVGVPSVLVVIALIIGAKLAGFWGILLAVPLASIFLELLSDIDTQKIPTD
jgi:predicted PurR-regulated permease PerM